jgi:hypothetical protein
MAQIDSTRELFYEKGVSYAAIAGAMGFGVKTMKKYVHMEDFNRTLYELCKV